MSAPHKPTTQTRGQVYALASFGIPQTKIAVYLDISPMTLTKHYRKELDTALIDLTREVANALVFNAIDKNNVTAQIFFLKTRAGWRETDKEEAKPNQEISKIQIEVINGKGEVKDE